jgi:hypothetical protein
MAACFTCKTRKAGNGYAGKFSAYCDLCQPKGADPRTGGLRAFSAAKCQPCDEVFTTDANFDRHIRGGAHRSPEEAGLELKSSGRWGMPGRADA